MWRSRSLEEWERKKSYLIRSLFEDVSIPSSILEEHEPASPSSPSNFVCRAESPLPDLIIELEPKKPNLHDDPEELYDALAKEMRRLYKKDFLDNELSTSGSENYSSESLKHGRIYDNVLSDESVSDGTLDENCLKDKYQIDYDVIEHQIDNDTDSLIHTDRSISKESSETIHITPEPFIVQVDVHSQEYEIKENLGREEQRFRERKRYRLSENSLKVSKTISAIGAIPGGNYDSEEKSDSESLDTHSQEYEIQENFAPEQQGFIESKQYRLSKENSLNVSNVTTTNAIESIQREEDDTEERSDSESFAKDTNASSSDSRSNSSVNSSYASPEIMRQRQPFVSSVTPPHPAHIRPVSELNSSVSKTIHASMESLKDICEDVIASNQEEEITEGSDNQTNLFVTSTPTRKRTSSRFSTQTGQKRRLVSYSSSSSFASVANAALQTSFSDCGTDWCLFWSNFFVGLPIVYNVCSCKEHVCST